MLTIVIPSFNHEKYVLDCIDPARSVGVFDTRIIVIDDGSTDSTVSKIEAFISDTSASNIKVISKSNAGLISSLNLGLSLADTEFFYVVASDDVPNPKGIYEAVEYLKVNPLLKFFIGGGINFFEGMSKETSIYGEKHKIFFAMNPLRRAREIFLNYPSPLLLQSTVFRVSALKEIGGWDPQIIWDDYPTFVKLLKSFPIEGRDFVFKPEVSIVKYRHHGFNTYKKVFKQFFMVKQAMTILAPIELRHKAIGRALAYYTLVGSRSADFNSVKDMIKIASWRSRLHAFLNVPTIVLNKFGRK